MASRSRIRVGLALLCALALGACAARAPIDGPPQSGSVTPPELPPDPVPRYEPRSAYGNGPIYEVYGQRYRVLDSSYGYEARGVASWYGRKFHGRLTASREPYDMYEMTAAHRSLPLPTYVEVRNLENDRRIVVRVNDRGPFVDDRLIDLSYAAAIKLDMVRDGTSKVEVRAISFEEPLRIERAIVPSAEATMPGATVSAPRQGQRAAQGRAASTTDKASPEPQIAGPRMYVQVGAFGSRENADRRHRQLRDGGIEKSFVHEEPGRSPTLYRVRVGPIDNEAQYDKVVSDLSRIGIADTHLVTE